MTGQAAGPAHPDVVEGCRVQGQQPAASDPPITDLVQTHGRPAPLHASNHGRPVGEGCDAIAVADQHIATMYLEGAIHEVPAPTEVRQYRTDPSVLTRDRIAAGNVPVDIVGEQCPDRLLVTTGVERLLGLMQPAQQFDSLGSIHELAKGSPTG
jgi:hypothetical protein